MKTATDLLTLALLELDSMDSVPEIVGEIQEFLRNAETVTITKDEYESLLEDSNFLCALESAGVDNWDGYDYARDIFVDMGE